MAAKARPVEIAEAPLRERERLSCGGSVAVRSAMGACSYCPRKMNMAIASRRITSSARPWVLMAPCM